MNRGTLLAAALFGAVAVWGCKSNVVSLNTGGSSSSSAQATGATVTSATATGASGSVTSTAASGGGVQCNSLCKFQGMLATQLSCAQPAMNCVSNCETVYMKAPQCTPQTDAFLNCIEQQANATTCHCDPQNGNNVTCPMICQTQAMAFAACLQMSATTSSSSSGTTTGAGG